MKLSNLLIGLFVLVILGTIAFFTWRTNQTSTINRSDYDYAVKDTASIDKIFVAFKTNQSLLFTRNEDHSSWTINHKYKVAPDMMDMLLRTLHDVELKRPVSKSERNHVINELSAEGIKIEIYRKNELFKTLFLGNGTDGDLGTNIWLKGAENPGVAQIRGFDGYLTARFNIEEINWRNRDIINCTPRTLQQLQITYTKNAAENVNIIFLPEKNEFAVENIGAYDTVALYQALKNYERIAVYQYLTNVTTQEKDSLLATTPICTLQLTHLDAQKSISLKVYPYPNSSNGILWIEKEQIFASITEKMLKRLLITASQLKVKN